MCDSPSEALKHCTHRLHLRRLLPCYFNSFRLITYLRTAPCFLPGFPLSAIASSLAWFVLFRSTTDLNMPTISTFAAGMFTGNFTIFRFVTHLQHLPCHVYGCLLFPLLLPLPRSSQIRFTMSSLTRIMASLL